MYLHLGQDYIVPLQSVVAVFDMDTATASKRTRLLLLERLQDEGRIIELYDDLPRAAVLCENALGETLYLTQLFSAGYSKTCGKGLRRVKAPPSSKNTFFRRKDMPRIRGHIQKLRKVPPDG